MVHTSFKFEKLRAIGAHHVHLLSIATLILVLCGSASAQFTGPTPFPVCAGTTANFNATASGRSYIWTFENTPVNFSLTSLPSSSVVHAGTPLSVPGYTTIDVESGKWISFVTNYSANEIIRMEYGTSPLNSPSLTSIGTGFGTGNRLEGIDLIKDNSGIWYGFAVNNTQLIRWQFLGNSITAAPINITAMNFPGTLAYPLQLSIKKFDNINEFVGFTANLNGSITRIDFGSALNTTPTLTNLPSTNLAACNFVLHEAGGNWYMLTSNLLHNTISRIEFGTNIQNNSPVVTSIGNPGGLLNLPRGIVLFPNCNPEQLIGYVQNEHGGLIKLDFNNDILNVPTATLLGTYSGRKNHLLVFPYMDRIYGLVPDFSLNSVERLHLFNISGPNTIDYYSSAPSYFYNGSIPFTTVALYTDQGGPMGANASCTTFKIYDCFRFTPATSDLREAIGNNLLHQNSPNPFKDETIMYPPDQLHVV